MELNKTLQDVVNKWKRKTQGEMIRKLNNKKIKNVTGKLRKSVMDIKLDISADNIKLKYEGPFYAQYIDARTPKYKGFKGFKKLPTHFLDPMKQFATLINELKKTTTDFIVKDINKEIKNK